ncbi:putative enzyme related to lactoylglutathione lyase [Actinoplanes octamycinicus]|uniref:Putative enzyme related to lactoylglutathione lyase n=1 Tax=Actinoplanes octamycinicus TaxID=135948 RepID=A0A7W7GUE1_9ACTN|nr:VOC family protein [Actinoplanes octamycinicus]MBB4738432.1 putative enzyme related to lactoylglutathione lyase [Actinoplanes octamycinicus]GIE57551.1 hydroxylase [Actinoplanes octamycinicus]
MTAPSPGVPTWVDLATSDLDGSTRFYTSLFGWTAEVSGAEFGGYTTFLLNGLPVAGAGPLFGEGQPTTWSTYLATDDADLTAARVEAAAGKVLVAPFDVMDQGRMAAFLDPSGAPFSVWEAGMMRGAEVFDVPGALTWNELNTRDVDGAQSFYGAVFGWTFREAQVGNLPYLLCDNVRQPVAGIQPMIGEGWPADISPYWLVYFAVTDCDVAAEHAFALGGRVVNPPTTISIGRYAVLTDPQGATFAVLAGRR